MRTLTTIIAALLLIGCTQQATNITILHTNDTHSHIEAEKDGHGGALNRAVLIEHIRDSVGHNNTLLFDCGDFSQGSLYYNIYKGAIEIDLMNALKYDAATIGNHEFDYGMENLAELFKRAHHPIVCANYDFTGTVCEGLTQPYTILERDGVRIGVFGLSPDPAGLVLKENYAGVKFLCPIDAANRCVKQLKKEECDLIICLSHLGWNIGSRYNDEQIATQTSGIDIIIGGHSHDLFKKPLTYTNNAGKEVVVQQAGKYGRNIGVIQVDIIR